MKIIETNGVYFLINSDSTITSFSSFEEVESVLGFDKTFELFLNSIKI